jgi:hypothetical protein
MAGHVLHDPDDAALGQPLQHSPPQCRDAHRVRPVGATGHRLGRIGLRHIEQRRAVDGNADLAEHHPQRLPVRARRLDRGHRRTLIGGIEHRPRRKRRPFGRAHPRDAAALLVDQDRQIVATRQCAQRIRQRANLRAVDDVALEQDIARGLAVGEERALGGGKDGAGQAEDDGLHDWVLNRKPALTVQPGKGHLPGAGRGPVGGRKKRRIVRRHDGLATWTPAFAGAALARRHRIRDIAQ